jgi:hypothetical protein
MDKTGELIRQQLCTINLKEVKELQEELLTDEELMARAASAEVFYDNYFKKVLSLLILAQLEMMMPRIEDTHQLDFSRGTINGLYLIKEWFENDQVPLSRSRLQPEEKPEPGETL